MKKEPNWYIVLDPETKECVEVLDYNVSCNPYLGGDYSGHCGGCDTCLLMQAEYWGFDVKPLILGEFETLGDAMGRLFGKVGT